MATYPQIVGEQERPASLHAEMTILGAMLVEPDSIVDAIDILEAEDFALDSHRRIFATILSLHEQGHPVDIVTVGDRLRKKKELDSIGGLTYLASLSEGLPRKLSIESYVRIVRDKGMLREAMNVGDLLLESASDQSEEALDVIKRAKDHLQAIEDEGPDADLETVGSYLASKGGPEQIFERLATPNGIKFGLAGWDTLTGGAQPGELHIIAARPSMGKTAWMCNIAYHVAVRSGLKVAVFSLEQPKDQIIRRMLSAATRIDAKEIKDGKLRQQDRALILEHQAVLAAASLYIDDRPDVTVTRIRRVCRRIKQKSGLDLIVIDQLNHLNWDDYWQRGMADHAIIGRQAKGCKSMGQELGVPVVLLCQLSRDTAKRTDPTPKLADLAESGKLEQHADVISFMHRPEYYNKEDKSLEGKGKVILAKNREGQTDTIDAIYQGRIFRWEDDTEPAAHQDSFYERTPW